VSSTTSLPTGIVGWAAPYSFSGVGDASFTRPGFRQSAQNYYSGYLSDTMTIGKLTINAGIRYDYQQSTNQPVTVPAPAYSATTWPEVPLTGMTVEGTPSLIWRIGPRASASRTRWATRGRR